MKMVTLTKEFKFEAAHQLYNHGGKCRNLHGHSYKVVLTVFGSVKPSNGDPDEGMVIDYDRMKEWWKSVEPVLDHKNLNDTLGLTIGPTTAENISTWLCRSAYIYLGGIVQSVTVCETASSSATSYTNYA